MKNILIFTFLFLSINCFSQLPRKSGWLVDTLSKSKKDAILYSKDFNCYGTLDDCDKVNETIKLTVDIDGFYTLSFRNVKDSIFKSGSCKISEERFFQIRRIITYTNCVILIPYKNKPFNLKVIYIYNDGYVVIRHKHNMFSGCTFSYHN